MRILPSSLESALSGADPPSASTRPETLRPMRAGLARMVAAARGAIAAVSMVAAIVGAAPPASWAWLGPGLALMAAWTAVYVAAAWSRGLRPWLIGVDLAVSAALSLAVGHLVPAVALDGTFSWVSFIVSMTVVSAQLIGVPLVSVPAGLLAAAAFVAGQRLAGVSGGVLTSLVVLVVQVFMGAAVMAVAMRVERTAVRAFLGLQEAQAAAALALARREDERAQLRLVHNGPLTTLTMALHAGSSVGLGPGASAGGRPPNDAGGSDSTLQRRAAAVLAALPALVVDAGTPAGTLVPLDERLNRVVAWHTPSLRITANLGRVLVPAAVGEAIAAAVSEALWNIVGHAGTDFAVIDVTGNADAVRVTVTDQGRGFDPAELPRSGFGFGLREDLAGRMDAIGGRAIIRSSPGAGTIVALEWHRG